MWIIFSGYLVSNFFEFLFWKLSINNFLNEILTIFEIVFGWLFHDYINQTFNITSGKYFMLNQDFRNNFIAQIILVIINIIFWIYTINLIEFGIFTVYLKGFTIFIVYYYFNQKRVIIVLQYFFKLINFRFYKTIFFDLKQICILIFFVFFFKIHSYFDLFYLGKLCILIFYFIFNIFFYLGLTYLFCSLIVISIPTDLNYLINIIMYKNYLYMIFICLFIYLLLIELINENITTNNFFKEFLLKLLFCIY